MGFWFPVKKDGDYTVGKYRFEMHDKFGSLDFSSTLLPVTVPVPILEKKITIGKPVVLPSTHFVVEIDILENPIPAAILIAGIAAVLVVAGGVLIIDKVEKLVENPAIDAALIFVPIAVIFLILSRFSKA